MKQLALLTPRRGTLMQGFSAHALVAQAGMGTRMADPGEGFQSFRSFVVDFAVSMRGHAAEAERVP